jgi:peptide/nickel transport system permease protein
MGKLFYDGVLMRDYPLIMGILVIGACLTLVGNLLADIGYAMADPRIRKA